MYYSSKCPLLTTWWTVQWDRCQSGVPYAIRNRHWRWIQNNTTIFTATNFRTPSWHWKGSTESQRSQRATIGPWRECMGDHVIREHSLPGYFYSRWETLSLCHHRYRLYESSRYRNPFFVATREIAQHGSRHSCRSTCCGCRAVIPPNSGACAQVVCLSSSSVLWMPVGARGIGAAVRVFPSRWSGVNSGGLMTTSYPF